MDPRVLLLTSNDGTQSGRSGYDVLADYLSGPNITTLRHPRKDPKGFIEKVLRKYHARGAASAWYLLSSRRLEQMAIRELRTGRFEVVHFLWTDRDWGYLDRETRRRGVKLVCTAHLCPDEFDLVYRHPERFAAIDALILMSSHQRAFFEAHGVDPAKIHVILHGIDTDHFRPAPEPARATTPRRFTVLSVGHTRRNFPVLKALIESMRDEPDCEFRIISKPQFKDQFSGLGQVRFESFLSNEELLRAYQDASALILTAEESTANNALLESLACGLPIVAEAVGGIPEYGGGSEGMVLCPPNDVEALKAGLLALMRDPEQRARRAAAARSRALELDWRHSVERIRSLYRTL